MVQKRRYFLPATALLLAGFVVPASAQVTCNVNAVTPILRTAGNTEGVGDIVLTCTSGPATVLTPAGGAVPQINIRLFLNSNETSLVTEHAAGSGNFDEALLLVDEPNKSYVAATYVPPVTPLLNCGNFGAPDNGPSGPGVCEIISDGVTTDTYNGAQWVKGTTQCPVPVGIVAEPLPSTDYGCGRPNAFQGRTAGVNSIDFLGVPFDPPAIGTGVRILRFTNIRVNAALLGTGGPHPITATFAILSSTAMTLTPPAVTVGYSQDGLISAAGAGFVHVQEGFASSFKYKNVAFALANATPGPTVPYPYIAGDQFYPADVAQNVPGVFYNTEDGFQSQPTNPPPSPNPPMGYSAGFFGGTNYPLFSAGYGFGGVNTGISGDGVASNGTRIAVVFDAPGGTVTVPNTVYIHRAPSGPITGVMVVTATDANGAGVFTPGPPLGTTTVHGVGQVVYEVLYSDPFSLEYANIPVAITGPLHEALAIPLLAPYYFTPGSGMATPTATDPTPTAIPRFSPVDLKILTIKPAPPTIGGVTAP